MPTPSSGTCWGGFTPHGRLMIVERTKREAWGSLGGIVYRPVMQDELEQQGYTVRRIKWEVVE